MTGADFVALRHQLQFTQVEMARLLQVGRRSLQKYEYGAVRPIQATLSRVEALRRALEGPDPPLEALARSRGFQRRASRRRSQTLGQLVDGVDRDDAAMVLHDVYGLTYREVGLRFDVCRRTAFRMARRARQRRALDKNAGMG